MVFLGRFWLPTLLTIKFNYTFGRKSSTMVMHYVAVVIVFLELLKFGSGSMTLSKSARLSSINLGYFIREISTSLGREYVFRIPRVRKY